MLIVFVVVVSGCVKDKPVPVEPVKPVPWEERFIAVVSGVGNLKFKINPDNITIYADGGEQCIIYFVGTAMSVRINKCGEFKDSLNKRTQ